MSFESSKCYIVSLVLHSNFTSVCPSSIISSSEPWE